MKSCIASSLAAVILSAPFGASAAVVALLNDGGFETAFSGPKPLALSSVGIWAVGDPALPTGAVNGITPYAGAQMLSFPAVGSTNAVSDDVYQIVDINPYASEIDAGLATIDGSVYWNAVAAASNALTIYAAPHLPTSFADPAFTRPLTQKFFTTDADKSTWQLVQVLNVKVPTGTRYLFFGLNHPIYPATPASYADNASLDLTIPVPLPGTLTLLSFALASLGLTRRKSV